MFIRYQVSEIRYQKQRVNLLIPDL